MPKGLNRPLTKDDVEYIVEDDPEGYGFVATITCAGFSASYTGPAAPSKKLAEHSAARQAVLNAFPDSASQLEIMDGMQQIGRPRTGRFAGVAAWGSDGEQFAGKKRKGAPPEDDIDIAYETWITEEMNAAETSLKSVRALLRHWRTSQSTAM